MNRENPLGYLASVFPSAAFEEPDVTQHFVDFQMWDFPAKVLLYVPPLLLNCLQSLTIGLDLSVDQMLFLWSFQPAYGVSTNEDYANLSPDQSLAIARMLAWIYLYRGFELPEDAVEALEYWFSRGLNKL